MSKRRRMGATALKFSDSGKGRCRWCDREVPPPKVSFCGKACVHEWRVRRDSQYVRSCLRRRDKGHCSFCGEDAIAIYKKFQNACTVKQKILKDKGLKGKKLKEKMSDFVDSLCAKIMWPKIGKWDREGSFWQADHILGVADGGGECGLENYQTLCTPCHRSKTNIENKIRREQKNKTL